MRAECEVGRELRRDVAVEFVRGAAGGNELAPGVVLVLVKAIIPSLALNFQYQIRFHQKENPGVVSA